MTVTPYHLLPPCTLLPLAARQQLIKASEIKDEKHRARAIDDTVARLKINYPQYWR